MTAPAVPLPNEKIFCLQQNGSVAIETRLRRFSLTPRERGDSRRAAAAGVPRPQRFRRADQTSVLPSSPPKSEP